MARNPRNLAHSQAKKMIKIQALEQILTLYRNRIVSEDLFVTLIRKFLIVLSMILTKIFRQKEKDTQNRTTAENYFRYFDRYFQKFICAGKLGTRLCRKPIRRISQYLVLLYDPNF